jgi:hypothetical protein
MLTLYTIDLCVIAHGPLREGPQAGSYL